MPAVKQENVRTTASCATPLFSYVIDVNTGCRRMQNARCLPTVATRDDIVLQTWSHLPRIHDTWKWHARYTGLFGQGPLLETYIIPQLVQDIPCPFSDPNTLKFHYPVHKWQSSSGLEWKRRQQIKITLIKRFRLQQNQGDVSQHTTLSILPSCLSTTTALKHS